MNKAQIKQASTNGSYFCARIAVIYDNGVPGHIWIDLDVLNLLETMDDNRVKEIVAEGHVVVFCEPDHE